MDPSQTIVLYKGQSQYDVLRFFIDDLAISFKKLGCDVETIDFMSPAWTSQLEKIIREKKVSFFLSINGIGSDLKTSHKSIYDELNIPFFSYLVDHPMYHIERLNQGVQNFIVSCVDKTHVDFLTKYMGGSYSKTFIPHGGSETLNLNGKSKPIEQRNINVLFAGSFTPPDQFRNEWLNADPAIAKIMDEVMERALYETQQTLMSIAEKVFAEKGLDPEYILHQKFWALLVKIDLYIRSRRREEVILSLKDMPMHIYGNGWDQVKADAGSITFHPAVTFQQVQELMHDSKLVLNVLPNFVEGGHERVFTSMLSGAVGVTDRNLYFDRHFKHEENVLLYDFEEKLTDVIHNALEDAAKLQNIADQGRQSVQSQHSWLARAEQILETVSYHKFFLS